MFVYLLLVLYWNRYKAYLFISLPIYMCMNAKMWIALCRRRKKLRLSSQLPTNFHNQAIHYQNQATHNNTKQRRIKTKHWLFIQYVCKVKPISSFSITFVFKHIFNIQIIIIIFRSKLYYVGISSSHRVSKQNTR